MLTRDIMTLIDQLEHLATFHDNEINHRPVDTGERLFHREAARQIRTAVKAIQEYEMAKR